MLKGWNKVKIKRVGCSRLISQNVGALGELSYVFGDLLLGLWRKIWIFGMESKDGKFSRRNMQLSAR